MLNQCTYDIRKAAEKAAFTLCMQARAYDVLDYILAEEGAGISREDAEAFCRAYDECGESVERLYDEDALRNEAESRVASLKVAMNEARFEAASAASLHEFAKEVFEIWQTSGIFARKRALKELRERAGFRLESHRIGNYVAKTFDLMNEAQARFARAQQAVFTADVSYKIKPGIYSKIADLLRRPVR